MNNKVVGNEHPTIKLNKDSQTGVLFFKNSLVFDKKYSIVIIYIQFLVLSDSPEKE